MNKLTQHIKTLIINIRPIDVYLNLLTKHDHEDLDLIFFDFLGITFTKHEKELKDKRIKQTEFRKHIIEKYNKCVISNFPSPMCEACHIIPFCESSDAEKYDVDNGLLLEGGIHKLFDDFLISINPISQTVRISKTLMSDPDYVFIHKFNDKYVPNLSRKTLQYLSNHFGKFNNC